ncbi:hypothetical protein D1627_15435 [Pontibacter oryzae]|uniref:Uncharacterized protein n=1 Tax=Pontibacter oryzae TaxID=2304593 RepID=A0A399RVG5_9BACT|nr:hypothetical protein D1627_15435 [Pontibacter oryzae]
MAGFGALKAARPRFPIRCGGLKLLLATLRAALRAPQHSKAPHGKTGIISIAIADATLTEP